MCGNNNNNNNIHTYIHVAYHNRMTRMTGPDCAVRCNLINKYTYIHTYIHTYNKQFNKYTYIHTYIHTCGIIE